MFNMVYTYILYGVCDMSVLIKQLVPTRPPKKLKRLTYFT